MADRTQAMSVATARQLRLLGNGSYATGKGNAQNDYIWDRFVMPATTQPQGIPLFRIPRSGQYGVTAGDQKTEIETSMEDNGKLAAGQNFLTNAICPFLVTPNGQTAAGGYTQTVDGNLHAWKVFQQHTNWTFKFTNTEYSWRAPGLIFLPAVFETGFSAAALATQEMVSMGNYQHLSWMNMPTKVPITEQVNFTLTAFTTSGSTAILTLVQNAMAFLNGTTIRTEVAVVMRGMLTRAV